MINGLTDDKAFLESLKVLAWSNVATTLLVHPDTGSVRLEVGIIPRDAYGMAVSHDLIRISQALLTDPVRMAIVIAHELTHCLDFKFVGSTLRTDGSGWATEINAHFNQGLIMREVYANMSQGYPLRGVFNVMAKGNSTFGNSMDWVTRQKVATNIRTTYRDLAERNDTRFTTEDAKWAKTGGLHYFPAEVPPQYSSRSSR